MTDLPDVNVWLALVDENHARHNKAKEYWEEQSRPKIAFCRVTELGFLRLSTRKDVLSRPLTRVEAWDIYRRYRMEAGVAFIEDSSEIDAQFRMLSCAEDFPHRLWTDSYLAALADYRNCRVVSFDTDFKRFPSIDFLHLKVSE